MSPGIPALLVEALRALAKHKVRNALAALGITIGTGAVVCVVSIGGAGTKRAEQQLANLGDNLVWVEAGSRAVNGVRTGSRGTTSLLPDDAEAIREEVPLIKAVAPNVDGSIGVEYGNRNWTTRWRGVGADFFAVRAWPAVEGTAFSPEQVTDASSVCVIGSTLRTQLFGQEDPVGKLMRLRHVVVCEVIGVLGSKGQNANGSDQDDVVIVPWTTAQKKILGPGHVWLDDILCSATSVEDVPPAIDQVSALLRQRHHLRPGEPDDFNIRRPDELIKAEIAAKRTMAIFLVSVAAISLVVGGVGIMNVMLASVTERTREIGVRMAVGARDGAVQIQFLGEAVMLSLFGGVAGAVLGALASLIVGASLDWPTSIPPLALVLAPFFSIVVGVFFGFYPARRAARLDPIVALRSE